MATPALGVRLTRTLVRYASGKEAYRYYRNGKQITQESYNRGLAAKKARILSGRISADLKKQLSQQGQRLRAKWGPRPPGGRYTWGELLALYPDKFSGVPA